MCTGLFRGQGCSRAVPRKTNENWVELISAAHLILFVLLVSCTGGSDSLWSREDDGGSNRTSWQVIVIGELLIHTSLWWCLSAFGHVIKAASAGWLMEVGLWNVLNLSVHVNGIFLIDHRHYLFRLQFLSRNYSVVCDNLFDVLTDLSLFLFSPTIRHFLCCSSNCVASTIPPWNCLQCQVELSIKPKTSLVTFGRQFLGWA